MNLDLLNPASRRRSRRALPNAEPEVNRAARLPPHSPEAEQGVLGCLLLSSGEALPEAVEVLKGEGDGFHDLRHRTIYEAMVKLSAKDGRFDPITLTQHLRDLGQLEAVGGAACVSALADATPSAAHLSYYLGIVKEKHVLRRILRVCGEACVWVYENPADVSALLDKVEKSILLINRDRAGLADHRMSGLIRQAHEQIRMLFELQGKLTGVASGYHALDKKTNGFHGGEMIVIAARPSVGKTSFALNIAEHVAVDQNLPVGVFSLEMSAQALGLRMLCSRARVNLADVRDGFLTAADFERLTPASAALAKAPIYIDDTGGLSILDIRAKARRMKQKHGIALLVVDYLQLCHSESGRAENRQQEIADISHGLKELAKELDVPVLVLSQMNRDYEREPKKRKPRLSDLRESGAIEQDADLVGLLYKPKEEEDEPVLGGATAPGIQINLLLAKHRNGPTGEVQLTFLKGYTRFETMAPIASAGVPVQPQQR